jgi:outer membrane protein
MDTVFFLPRSMKYSFSFVLCAFAFLIGLNCQTAQGEEATSYPAGAVAPAPAVHNFPTPSSEATSQRVVVRDCQNWPCGDFSREPPNFNPWWEDAALRPLRPECPPLQMELDSVVLGTLCFSPQVNVMRKVAPIREDSIVEAQGDFDLRAFVDSKFLDTSDPIGSELMAPQDGERYLDQNWYYNTGIRKKSLTGTQIELGQKIGYENSNSQWFTPELQGSARLQLSITQPLLNGAGKAYNTRLIVLAQIDAQSGRDRVARDLQTLMLDLYHSYWDLHLQRALLLQKRRLYERGVEICRELEGRRDIDAVGGQLARAKAAVASRYAAVVRQEALLLNTDAKLRTLINDPQLLVTRDQELIPMQRPLRTPCPLSFQDSLIVAFNHRPEINEARAELKAASVRQEVAKNELLPVLNLILMTYVSGIEGDVNIGRALGDQFNLGRPTYATGMTFEYPLGNRTARAKYHRRQLEILQLTAQLVATTSNVRLEVETAVREITTSYREMLCQAHAVLGNETEIGYLKSRWDASLDEARSSSVLLDDLLNAHDRLARSEGLYAAALVGYNEGFAKLNQATGTLVDCQQLLRSRAEYDAARGPMPTDEAKTSRIPPVPETAASPQSPQKR